MTKNKTVCFVDNGLFVSFARKVAVDFKKAYYYCPWQTYAAQSNQIVIGKGFDEMERCLFPFDIADDVDLWVFLDLYHCDLQCYLESHGARVWGARLGEEMELHRWAFKQYLKKLGLPVQPCEHIFGIDDLCEHLKTVENKYVKTSFVRGDFETFRHDTFKLSQPRLDEIIHHLGPVAKDKYEFIVEDEIPDAVEVGYDGYSVDGEFPSHSMMAYEVKDVGMIGTVKEYSKLADPVRLVNDRLSAGLKKDNYRGFLCTEIRYTKTHEAYLIDPCCRLGSPSNELLQELFDGWAEVLWEGAEGKLVSPRAKAKFGVCAVIHSEFAVDNWQSIYYPKEVDQWVKLRMHSRIQGVDYTVPQPVGLPLPGVVVGVGESLLEAVDKCKEYSTKVKGYQVQVSLESIGKAVDIIQKGEDFGIHFSDSPLPTVEELS